MTLALCMEKMTMSDVFLRIEHKLDVIINYLHGITNVAPEDIPKQVPGAGGLTSGRCPITDTPIYYSVDPKTGNPMRVDGLDSGMRTYIDAAIPAEPSWKERNTYLGNINEGEDT